MSEEGGKRAADNRPQDWAARSPRLFVENDLCAGVTLALNRGQSHYLAQVLRLKPGEPVLLFNCRNGEWSAAIDKIDRKSAMLSVLDQIRAQPVSNDLHYVFAPLKHARLDYLVQKATEMGVSRLRPVFTRRTAVSRVKLDRMRANAIEAAEQCGTLSVPQIDAPVPLDICLGRWDHSRTLVFADETAEPVSPIEALSRLSGERLGVLVGPEGGFDDKERTALLALPFVTSISLGPRILRGDTAAVVALTLVQAVAGDWSGPERN